MVPMVNDAEQAKAVVNALRFAPLGARSYGGRRVIDVGGRMYYKEQELLIVAQVETAESVANSAAIIATKGIDVLFFGPDDMKTQLGLPINTPITESQELREGMAKVARAAKDAGKFAGCVAGNPAALLMSVEMGYQLIVGGGDIVFLRDGSARKIEELRNALKSRKAGKEAGSTGIYGG
jgi:4-hydroxy-2-oxoheptanedioate aldolase